MEIPDLVRERLGGETVEATVNLGDEDLVCVTPTRTLVYRSEGLLSDESVEVFEHDVERLDVSEGRRKTKFLLEYVDGTESFTVPADRAENVLKLLLSGVLGVEGVVADDETVGGVFTFSELTLVVTGARLIKHVGTPIWDADHEVYPYEAVTGLEFEEGSVATQVVLSVDGRPQRIKAPNDEAPRVEQALTQALFAYHGVDSLAELNETLGADESADDAGEPAAAGESGEFDLTDDISPLVGERDGGDGDETRSGTAAPADGPASPDERGGTVDTVSASAGSTTSGSRSAGAGPAAEDIEAIESQLSELTAAVEKQNELLADQQETIQQLIEELRRGR